MIFETLEIFQLQSSYWGVKNFDVHSGWKSYRRHDKDIRKGDSTRPLDLLRLRRSRLRNPLNRGAPRDEFSGKPSRLYITRKKNSHQNCLSPYFLEIPNFPHQKQKKPPKRWAYIRESFFCINYLFQPPTKIPWFLLVDRSHILPRSQGTLVNLDQFRVVSRVPWRLYRWRLGGFWFKRLYGGGFDSGIGRVKFWSSDSYELYIFLDIYRTYIYMIYVFTYLSKVTKDSTCTFDESSWSQAFLNHNPIPWKLLKAKVIDFVSFRSPVITVCSGYMLFGSHVPSFIAGQPGPPPGHVPPLGNKVLMVGLSRPYSGKVMVHKPWIRPYWGGSYVGEG